MHFPNGGELWILNYPSPMSAWNTRLFSPPARNSDATGPLDAVHAFNLKVFEENRLMIEAQSQEDLPLDFSQEFHLAANRSSVN